MPHLDEGQLHAYLDGEPGAAEHLERCAECRARLDDVRRVRERAQEILSGSGPVEVHRPAFAELEARARARRGPEKARFTRLRTVGLAASLVLAAALGWAARGALTSGQPLAPRTVAARGLPSSDTVLAQPPPANEPRKVASAPAATPPARTLARQQTAAPSTPPAEAQSGAGAAAENLGVTSLSIRTEEAKEQPRARLDMAAPQPAARSEMVAGLADAALRPWQAVSESTATEFLGRRPATIPGLPIAGYDIGQFSGQPALRVRQQSDRGVPIELIQWMAGGRQAADALEADSTGVVTIRRGDLVITATSAMSRDALLQLLGTIKPER